MKYFAVIFLLIVVISCQDEPDQSTRKDAPKDCVQDSLPPNIEEEISEIYNPKKTKIEEEISVETKESSRIKNAFQGFKAFYQQFEKKSEKLEFSTKIDTILVCSEGTTIKIESDCFETESGDTIQGNVRLEIQEFYKAEDILLANLTTTCGEKLIETGGMVNIQAFSESEKCVLREGKTIEIGFPYADKKEGMQVFEGEWRKGKIDWQLGGTVPVDTSRIYDRPDVMPEYPGGEAVLINFVNTNVKYPSSAVEKGIQGTVSVSFVVNEEGLAENAVANNDADSLLAEAAIAAVQKLKGFLPGKVGGIPVKVNMNIPVKFSILGGLDGSEFSEDLFTEEFEKEIQEGKLSKDDIARVGRYLLSTSNLGWINCDRFIDMNVPRVDYAPIVYNSKKMDFKLVFEDIDAIMPGELEKDRVVFKNIPKHFRAKLIVLKWEKDQFYLAIQNVQIKKKDTPKLNFIPVTLETLKEKMKGLRVT